MARIGLATFLDSSFVNRLTGLASPSASNSLGNSFTQALKGNKEDQVSISSGLRLGAKLYANGVQALNSTISVINESSDTLGKLGKITDKLISITARASDSSTSDDTRRKLDLDFRELATKFRDTVNESSIGNYDYLSKDGLAAIFERVGLSKKDSQSIAEVFQRFELPKDDDEFASERVRGSRPVSIPPGAYKTPVSDTSYQLHKLTDSAVSGQAGISVTNSVFGDVDNILNQNPGYNSVFTNSGVGSLTTVKAGALTASANVLAVNEATGYSVVKSSSNLFNNYNPGGFEQLFLVDNTGTVVHQITNNSSAATYIAADLNSDDTEAVYSYDDGGGTRYLDTLEYVIGTDPSLYTAGNIDSDTGNQFNSVKIDNSGKYFAYQFNDGLRMADQDFIIDTTLELDRIQGFGFLEGGGRIAYSSFSISRIIDYTYGGSSAQLIEATINSSGEFTTLQIDGGYSSTPYIAFVANGSNTLSLYQVTGVGSLTSVVDYSLGSSPSVTQLSAAYQSDGQHVDIGVLGSLPSFGGDTDTEFYRLKFNSLSTNGQRFTRTTVEPDYILDSNITKRSDAYRVLSDLKALREQIDDNLKALDSAKDVVTKNVELSRATALAMLELSEQIPDDLSASDVAQELRKKVRKQASSALSQAENLEPIIVAALALDLE